MSNRQQLEQFHQHLTAIELAGFKIQSQLFVNPETRSDAIDLDASAISSRLQQITVQLGEHEGEEFMRALVAQPNVTRVYVSSFQQWIDSGEKIASLEPLMAEPNLRVAASQGLSCTWLHLGIFSGLGLIALTTVWGLSLRGIQDLVSQLGVSPPWALRWLLIIQPHFLWVVAGVVMSVLLFGWFLKQRFKFTEGQSDAEQALGRARLAGLLCDQIDQRNSSSANDQRQSDISASDTPLLHWACNTAPTQGLDARKVLGLTKRLYLWISFDRSQRSSVSTPQLTGAAVGGVIALGTGLLLFYPLVQLLKIVIDTSGLLR